MVSSIYWSISPKHFIRNAVAVYIKTSQLSLMSAVLPNPIVGHIDEIYLHTHDVLNLNIYDTI